MVVGMTLRLLRFKAELMMVVGLVVIGSVLPGQPDGTAFSPYVDAKGDISLPQNFRTDWAHLGSWALADGFHDVYLFPASAVAEYRETGVFVDGAVMVKEVRGQHSGPKTTGQAQWAGDIIQWFVMVKDSQNRFPDNPLWGDGWGWALFKPEHPLRQLATGYRADCMGCHIPAAKTDRIYIEGYPTLQSNR
jgi:hypothetical protein